jgi:CheY-like chemotaxis protein
VAVAQSKTVLVVDDETVIRAMVAEALSDEGYTVITAANGAEALELLKRHRPTAVVLDLMMPVMNGYAFLAACRAEPQSASTPVLVLSAAPSLSEISAPVMRKPFELEHLLSTVARLTARSV